MHVSAGHGRCGGALPQVPGSVHCVVGENIRHRDQVVIGHKLSRIAAGAVNRYAVIVAGPYSASNVEYVDAVLVQCGCMAKACKSA